MQRIEEIIEHLDANECTLAEGEEIYEEGQRLLAEIRDRLNDGTGGVVERVLGEFDGGGL